MFRILLSILTLVLGINLSNAQQDPYYAHFTFNKQSYNPAAVGSVNDYICLSAIGHKQWVGFNDQTWINRQTGALDGIDQLPTNVAPTTYNFNVNGQLVSNGVRFGGIGMSITDDRLGATKMTTVKSQFAYFLNFKNGNRLALGAELGLSNFGFVNPKFRARQSNDPNIPTSSVAASNVEVSSGIYYTQHRFIGRTKNFYAGVSMQHVNQAVFHLVQPDFAIDYQLKPHYYFLTGLSFSSANGLFEIMPSMLVKYNSEPQVNFNVMVERDKQYRFGLGYRQGGNSDAIIAFCGYRFNQMIFGYSYDMTTSKIRNSSSGTHELAVKWCFRKPQMMYHKTPREM
jgi:type IX secretion system PorP/SprF family membrane protein